MSVESAAWLFKSPPVGPGHNSAVKRFNRSISAHRARKQETPCSAAFLIVSAAPLSPWV